MTQQTHTQSLTINYTVYNQCNKVLKCKFDEMLNCLLLEHPKLIRRPQSTIHGPWYSMPQKAKCNWNAHWYCHICAYQNNNRICTKATDQHPNSYCKRNNIDRPIAPILAVRTSTMKILQKWLLNWRKQHETPMFKLDNRPCAPSHNFRW